MKKLCALNIGIVSFDFGGGKGKYINNGTLSTKELAKCLLKK